MLLTRVSGSAAIGDLQKATVIIDGPNDGRLQPSYWLLAILVNSSTLSNLSQYTESRIVMVDSSVRVYEDEQYVAVTVMREGLDLGKSASVWCTTRISDPASATPGVDYVPMSQKLQFKPGQSQAVCTPVCECW